MLKKWIPAAFLLVFLSIGLVYGTAAASRIPAGEPPVPPLGPGDCWLVETFVDPALSGIIQVNQPPNCMVYGPAFDGYLEGTYLTLTATPAGGYGFGSWQEEGLPILWGNPFQSSLSFTVADRDYALTAVFAPLACRTLDLTAVNGSVERDPAYNCIASGIEFNGYYDGTDVELTAVPDANYDFVDWEEDDSSLSTDNPYTITMDADRAITANFTEKACHTLTLYADNGSVDRDPAYNCATSGETNNGYYDGTEVELTAVPDTNYGFVDWEEDSASLSAANPYTVTMDADRAITANFAEDACHTLTLYADNGSVERDPAYNCATSGETNNGYYDGTEVELTATANAHYTFADWEEDSASLSAANPYTVTMDANRYITANFAEDACHTLTLYADNGSVDRDPAYNCATSGVENNGYYDGTEVELTAVPDAGYSFVDWEEDSASLSTANPYTITMDADRALTANFSQDCFTLSIFVANGSVERDPAYNCSTSGGENDGYAYNTSVELTALPDAGYSFEDWEENSTSLSTENPYTISITADRALTANISQDCYTLTIYTDHGTVAQSVAGFEPGFNCATSGGDNDGYLYGTQVMLQGTPDAGYSFGDWSEDDAVLSTDNPYTITMQSDRAVSAYFSQDCYELEITDINGQVTRGTAYNCALDGVGDPDGYTYNTSVELTAVADSGYDFWGWLEDDTLLSQENPYTVTVTQDRVLTASFLVRCYELDIYADNGSVTTTVGSVSPGYNCALTWEGDPDGFAHGTEVLLTGVGDTGYSLASWEEDSVILSDQNPYTITLTSDRALTANFGLTPPTPIAPAVDAVLYDGTPTFQWEPAGWMVDFHLQVKDPGGSLIVDTVFDGTEVCGGALCQYTLPTDLAANYGAYQWHIKGEDAVQGSAFSPWQTFTYTRIAAPLMLAPAESGAAGNPRPTFQWSESDGALRYLLQVRDSLNVLVFQGYSPYDACTDGTCTFQIPDALATGEYTWHVRGFNGANWGFWSPWWGFTLWAEGPVLLTPAAADAFYIDRPAFTWESLPNAESYDLQLQAPDLSLILLNGLACAPDCAHQLAESLPQQYGAYQWQMRAVRGGTVSPWSGWRGFTYIQVPAPASTVPANNFVTTLDEVTFTWQPGEPADNYLLQVRGLDYSILVEERLPAASCGVDGCSLTLSGLPYRGMLWRVRGSLDGNISEWSTERRFTVLGTPALRSPGVDGIIYGGRPTFKWYKVQDAGSYELAVYGLDDSLLFSVITGGSCDDTLCSYRLPFDLESNFGSYDWQVRSRLGGVQSDWSALRTLTYTQLERTWIISPPSGSVTFDLSPTLQWGDITGATMYLLQIRDLSGNLVQNTLVSDALFCSGGTCTWAVDPELAIGEYQWHVRAKNGRNFGRWTAYSLIEISTPAP